MPVKPQERQITSCRARAGQHARPSHKHCKACAKHAHAPHIGAHACLYGFHGVEFSNQPVPVQLNNKLKQQAMAPVKPQERRSRRGHALCVGYRCIPVYTPGAGPHTTNTASGPMVHECAHKFLICVLFVYFYNKVIGLCLLCTTLFK